MQLHFNGDRDRWEASVTVAGRAARITIQGGDYPESERDMVAARVLAKVEGEWPRIQQNIADSLLTTYNESWSDPDGGSPELSREEFLQHVRLETISVMEEEALSLYFTDSGIFGGHYVDVFWNSDGKMYEAGLSG